MNKAAAAEIKLQKACEKLGVSKDGLFWLDHALDPFKDMVRPHPGYPDKNMDPSVVEVVKQTVVVTAPGVVNWDASIFLDQILIDTPLYQTQTSANFFYRSGQLGVPHERGGLVVRTATSGTPLDTTTARSNIPVDPALYTNEMCRVVGCGFEVHDTTNELHKQGNVVCWRLDQPPATSNVTNFSEDAGVTACIPSSAKSVILANPPVSSSEAIDIMGSVQWEAKEGCYMVPVLTSDTNDAVSLTPLIPIVSEGGVRYCPLINTVGANKQITCNVTGVQSPWSMCGAFFSGLDPSASLTINFIYFIERFPNKVSSIKRLCYPSPPFDDRALEVYSDVAREIPVGVMVKDNGAGDWIAGIAKIVGNVASLIPHPVAQTIGMGAKFVGNLAQPRHNNQLTLPSARQMSSLMPRVIDVTNTVTGKHKEIVLQKNDVITRGGGVSNAAFYRRPQTTANQKRVNRLKKATKGLSQPDNSFKKSKGS